MRPSEPNTLRTTENKRGFLVYHSGKKNFFSEYHRRTAKASQKLFIFSDPSQPSPSDFLIRMNPTGKTEQPLQEQDESEVAGAGMQKQKKKSINKNSTRGKR